MENDNIINGNCWVAYFDIMGFKNLLTDFIAQYKTKEEVPAAMDAFVEVYYKEILRKLEEKGKYSPGKVFIHWFSDSFFLYTADDSAESLVWIHLSASHFFLDVIRTRMALRGALSVGAFYADKEKGVFLGPALIDAYQYAEKQHCIGFVLTPKARSESQKLDLCPPDRGNYVEYGVPVKTKERNIKSEVAVKTEVERLFSFKMQNFMGVEQSIAQMQKEAKNKLGESEYDKVNATYENTLKFISDTR